MARRFTTRFGMAASAAILVLSLSASAALAGEITGNGMSLKNADGTLNGRSECAFSGQEDLQFGPGGSKGVPGHAQSWGQIPKAVRDTLPAFLHPGIACNPTKSGGEPG